MAWQKHEMRSTGFQVRRNALAEGHLHRTSPFSLENPDFASIPPRTWATFPAPEPGKAQENIFL